MGKIVVLGTGMSGTGYLRRLFEALGYRASHESVYSAWGYLGWRDYEVGVSSYAAGYPLSRDYSLLHVLRDPLLCLRAHMSNHVDESGKGFWFLDYKKNPTHPAAPHAKWWREHLPSYIYDTDDAMSRPLRFIHYWTSYIEASYAGYPKFHRSKLETISPDLIRRVCDKWDLPVEDALKSLPRDINSKDRAFDSLTWADVERHPEGHLLYEVQEFYDSLP